MFFVKATFLAILLLFFSLVNVEASAQKVGGVSVDINEKGATVSGGGALPNDSVSPGFNTTDSLQIINVLGGNCLQVNASDADDNKESFEKIKESIKNNLDPGETMPPDDLIRSGAKSASRAQLKACDKANPAYYWIAEPVGRYEFNETNTPSYGFIRSNNQTTSIYFRLKRVIDGGAAVCLQVENGFKNVQANLSSGKILARLAIMPCSDSEFWSANVITFSMLSNGMMSVPMEMHKLFGIEYVSIGPNSAPKLCLQGAQLGMVSLANCSYETGDGIAQWWMIKPDSGVKDNPPIDGYAGYDPLEAANALLLDKCNVPIDGSTVMFRVPTIYELATQAKRAVETNGTSLIFYAANLAQRSIRKALTAPIKDAVKQAIKKSINKDKIIASRENCSRIATYESIKKITEKSASIGIIPESMQNKFQDANELNKMVEDCKNAGYLPPDYNLNK